MLNKFKILVAAAALSGTMSANAYAATITVQPGDSLWSLSKEHKASIDDLKEWNHLITNNIHPGDVLTITVPESDNKGCTIWDQAKTLNSGFSVAKKWDKNISAFIHPEKILEHFNMSKTVAKQATPATTVKEVVTVAKPVVVKTVRTAPIQTVPVHAAPKVCPAKPAVQETPETKPAAAAATNPVTESAAVLNSDQSVQDTDDKKEIIVKATAYTASCEGCSGITATGVNIKDNPDEKVIAVDPKVIPLGSKVYVEGFGEATAADTGGAIKGNRIDVFIPSENDAKDFGVKRLKVTILD